MTRKQSYAIYCKTGVDVRSCELSQETVSALFDMPWIDARNTLQHTAGAVLKRIPDHKGDWKYREYDLFHTVALKNAEQAYGSACTDCTGDPVYGGAAVIMPGTSGFGRYMRTAYKGKKGVRIPIKFGDFQLANLQAAAAYVDTITGYGLTQDADYTKA